MGHEVRSHQPVVGGLFDREEPVAKAINPMITWQSLLFHPETMTTLSIEVQFDRVTGISPCRIEWQTRSRTHRVIVGGQQKQRRRIGWDSDTRSRKGRVNGTTILPGLARDYGFVHFRLALGVLFNLLGDR
jgi:hypothetical protein